MNVFKKYIAARRIAANSGLLLGKLLIASTFFSGLADAQTYPRLNNPRNSGDVKVLAIIADYQDKTHGGTTNGIISRWESVFEIVEEYWIRNSYGKITSFDVEYAPPVRLPYNIPEEADRAALLARTGKNAPLDAVMADVTIELAAGGIDVNDYDVLLRLFRNGGIVSGIFGSAGSTAKPGGVYYTGDAFKIGAIENTPSGLVHEMGHALGIHHPGVYNSTPGNVFPGYSSRGDGLSPSMMGSGRVNNPYSGRLSYSAIDPVCRYGLRYLTDANVKTAQLNETVRIYDFNTDQLTPGRNVAAVVNIPSGRAIGDWWLCFNPTLSDTLEPANSPGTDVWRNGIGVFKRNFSGSTFVISDILDFTPNSIPGDTKVNIRDDARDGALTIGSEWTFPESNIRLKPISKGTRNGVGYIDVQIIDANNPGGSTSGQTSFRYDFGTPSSPLEGGFLRASESSFQGGAASWASTPRNSRNRNSGSNRDRDLVQGSNTGVISHNLSNGTWKVNWRMGDTAAFHDRMGIRANGVTKASEITTNIGQIRSGEFTVAVTNGVLTLDFFDGGGSDVNWVLNALELTKEAGSGSGSGSGSETSFKFDFGLASSPLAGGYLRATDSSFQGTTTSWTSVPKNARNRNSGSSRDRDLVQGSNPGVISQDLSNGTWKVKWTMGDTAAFHDLMGIKADGVTKVSNITTNIGQIRNGEFTVAVTGGNLSLEFFDGGGSDVNWVLNALELTKEGGSGGSGTPPSATSFKFDFGKPNSAVASGWTKVTEQTTSGAFRWTNANSLFSRDRNRGSSLRRDFIQSKQPRTFSTDVSNGTWLVKITFGDYTNFHDLMEAKAEGVLKSSNVTRDKTVSTTTPFTINVTDGTLDLEFSDGGGRDQNWAVNAVELIKQ